MYLILHGEIDCLDPRLNVAEEGGLPELLILPNSMVLDQCVRKLKENGNNDYLNQLISLLYDKISCNTIAEIILFI
jgi:hypothetical protein